MPSQVVAATNSSTTPRSSLAKLRGLHESWWSKFWPAGGVLTLDNSPMEAFWYTQLFKFASGTRAGRSVHDLQVRSGFFFIAVKGDRNLRDASWGLDCCA